MDDERPKPPPSAIQLGADIGRLSVDEIEERIGLLKEEITRLEDALVAKRASRHAADAVFKL
ncbi:hypothetical protein GCM10007301_00110 [Azorhizobium oxalatiphilum]|uniref:DUF1192 domain-containing protein n=1 Tax=Azorhizobium oxalatiphilum TaxID=980631 RepID=A0A917BGS0_9HYPH|nr:DUF1192 domain-containing protein [Azorhizobium oxalatiphilum]GGF44534.1 hypothetical protein GCM10007301_00110 [Azorhizobium oxalatiphilum]